MPSQRKGVLESVLKGGPKGGRKGEPKKELIEVFLTEPGEGRPPFTHEPGALEFLSPDVPIPDVGDILLLPRKVTGDSKAQAFAWGGTVTPFKIVEREHLYFRDKAEKFTHIKPTPARYVRTVILVRRLTQEEYAADPGTIQPGTPAASGS